MYLLIFRDVFFVVVIVSNCWLRNHKKTKQNEMKILMKILTRYSFHYRQVFDDDIPLFILSTLKNTNGIFTIY